MLRKTVPFVLAFPLLSAAAVAGDTQLKSVSPAPARVMQKITLRGEDFGAFTPGVSKVLFETPRGVLEAKCPYVWRDDFIQIQVPAGGIIGTEQMRMPPGEVKVYVTGVNGTSRDRPLRMATQPAGQETAFSLVQRTQLVNHFDMSNFLGTSAQNMARTKDAEVGEVNGDGFPDLIDNNSNNILNSTHAILRFNQNGQGFTSMDFEPRNAQDVGTFAVTVPPGGVFVGDGVIYDGDFVDLNNDGLDDWVGAHRSPDIVRVSINNHQGVPGKFLEQTNVWLPGQVSPGSADDVCSADANGDGFLDVAIAYRFSGTTRVYLNNAGASFTPVTVQAVGAASIHDIFFVDANDDAFWDVCLVNESGNTQIFFHNGNLANPAWSAGVLLNWSGESGFMGDFNNDGLHDVALAGFSQATTFLNNPGNPGTFTQASLPTPGSGTFYDVEVGDIDLDGNQDIGIPNITTLLESTIRLWQGHGNGTYTNLTTPGTTAVFPGAGPYQRLSFDMIDYDVDGDLDVYITGADGAGAPGQGFGMVANQFWENQIIQLPMTFFVHPKAVTDGDTVGFTTFDGQPGAPVITAFLDVNGLSLFLPLVITTFNGNGELILSLGVPPGLNGLTLTMASFGTSSGGQFAASNTQVLDIL